MEKEKFEEHQNHERQVREEMRTELSLHERRNKQLMAEAEDLNQYKIKKDSEVFHMKTWISEKDDELE
jgi:hypothetical protein